MYIEGGFGAALFPPQKKEKHARDVYFGDRAAKQISLPIGWLLCVMLGLLWAMCGDVL